MIKLYEIMTTSANDQRIYGLISDWVISSLNDGDKRNAIGEELSQLEIPEEYKEVPSNFLYRVVRKDIAPFQNKFTSYSYDLRGVTMIKKWMKDIYELNDDDLETIKVPLNKVNIIISIPTFLKKTGLSSGKRFDKIWKTEYEVITKKTSKV